VYSMSTDVLGRVVEVVSGMELDRFIAERITKPLGMTSTGFYVPEADHGRLAQAQLGPDGKPPTLLDSTQKPRWLSGGGGMVSSAADYLRFSAMLLNGGEYGGVRILSPHTVRLMTSDALPPGIGFTDRARHALSETLPTPANGQGFGLGFSIRTATGHNPLPDSIGTFYWTGAYGTSFWIDPQLKLIGMHLVQMPSPQGFPYRRTFRMMVYSALTGTDIDNGAVVRR
jgi:CubicO group peptidase (beta-lactamase class C family)